MYYARYFLTKGRDVAYACTFGDTSNKIVITRKSASGQSMQILPNSRTFSNAIFQGDTVTASINLGAPSTTSGAYGNTWLMYTGKTSSNTMTSYNVSSLYGYSDIGSFTHTSTQSAKNIHSWGYKFINEPYYKITSNSDSLKLSYNSHIDIRSTHPDCFLGSQIVIAKVSFSAPEANYTIYRDGTSYRTFTSSSSYQSLGLASSVKTSASSTVLSYKINYYRYRINFPNSHLYLTDGSGNSVYDGNLRDANTTINIYRDSGWNDIIVGVYSNSSCTTSVGNSFKLTGNTSLYIKFQDSVTTDTVDYGTDSDDHPDDIGWRDDAADIDTSGWEFKSYCTEMVVGFQRGLPDNAESVSASVNVSWNAMSWSEGGNPTFGNLDPIPLSGTFTFDLTRGEEVRRESVRNSSNMSGVWPEITVIAVLEYDYIRFKIYGFQANKYIDAWRTYQYIRPTSFSVTSGNVISVTN